MRFWDASGVALRPLYKLSTAGLFQTDCEHADGLAQAAEDDWPPFRKVGPALAPVEPAAGSAPCHRSIPFPRWAALTPTAMTLGSACRRWRSASTQPRW